MCIGYNTYTLKNKQSVCVHHHLRYWLLIDYCKTHSFHTYRTVIFRQHWTLFMLLLETVMSLSNAQFLRLVYIDRSGNQPGNNRIFLECRRNSFPVHHPQIFVERSDLPRQPVRIVGNQNGRVTIEITQDLEGLYSCSDNGDRSTNTLALVGKKS